MTKTKLATANEAVPSITNPKRIARYHEMSQHEDGSEHLNPISLVSDVDMHPLSLGEQMLRFVRSPDLLYDFDDSEDFDIDDQDSDRMTAYEDRTHESLRYVKRKKEERIKKQNEEKAEAAQKELDEFAKRYEARRLETDQVATPPAKPPVGEA